MKVLAAERGSSAEEALVKVQISVGDDPTQPNGKTHTDAYDVRLFRDGELVRQWPQIPGGIDEVRTWRTRTHVEMKGMHEIVIPFRVQLPTRNAGKPVMFTAYAFNEDRVKSGTATASYTVPEDVAPRKPRAYVITVGADGYDAPERTLQFAVSDAEAMRTALSKLDGYEVEAVSLTSGADPAKRHATKAELHEVLARLAGRPPTPGTLVGVAGADRVAKATPDDLVIATFSGHGYTQADGTFYLLGSDSGRVDEPLPRALAKFISSEELSEWLRPIDAGQMALIIDACHSAASVDQPGFKPGPMGDRGLGQLAYDKAMRILAASQADDVALESARLNHGLLTYALAVDGLATGVNGKRNADLDGNGSLTLAEWLRYGEEHTPTLYEDIRNGQKAPVFAGRNAIVDPDNFRQRTVKHAQTPALFDFAKSSQADAVIK